MRTSPAVKRVQDFESRRSNGPEGRVHPLRETAYISVQPFSDDKKLLAEIGWQASKCTGVDAYWHVMSDVVFVQVSAASTEPVRAVGWYVRWIDAELPRVNVVAVVREPRISQTVFERELLALLDAGVVGPALKAGRKLGQKLKAVRRPSKV